MNKYYEEVELPQVPEWFNIRSEQEFIDKGFTPCHPYPEYQLYRQYKLDRMNELEEILQPHFQFDLRGRIFYQIVRDKIAIHKDTGRVEIFNYIFDAGGDNVYTHFLDEDKETEVFKVSIPERTWHKMDVSYYHTVTGITSERIALSVYESVKTC